MEGAGDPGVMEGTGDSSAAISPEDAEKAEGFKERANQSFKGVLPASSE
jgi:hypothetical protein